MNEAVMNRFLEQEDNLNGNESISRYRNIEHFEEFAQTAHEIYYFSQ
jgi:hypothetical protein